MGVENPVTGKRKKSMEAIFIERIHLGGARIVPLGDFEFSDITANLSQFEAYFKA